MKHYKLMAPIALFVGAMIPSVSAQEVPTPTPDPFRVAQAIGGIVVAYYDCNVTMYIDDGTGSSIYRPIRFKYVPGVGIVRFEIFDREANQTIVVWDEEDVPRAGLPTSEPGTTITNFALYATGYDASGVGRIYGLNQPADDGHLGLRPGEPIRMLFRPDNVRRFIAFALPAGVDPAHFDIESDSGSVFGRYDRIGTYDSDRGGFEVVIDPTVVTPYRIIDTTTGLVYFTGSIDPVGNDPGVTATESSIQFGEFVGGVTKIGFEDGDIYVRHNQSFTGVMDAPWYGSSLRVLGRVYVLNNLAGRPLNFRTWRGGGCDDSCRPKIIAYRWQETGEMTPIRNEQGYINVDGEDSLVVVVYGLHLEDTAPYDLRVRLR